VNAPVTDALLAVVDPQPGDVVLDLAGGTGDVAAALAGRVAAVLSTDLSPAMVAAAAARALPGVEHRVMDMQELDLADATYDAAVCRFGVMLVPEPLRALRETRRVLRRGGRFAFATWAPARSNPWATAYGPVLLERGLQQPPKPGEPGQFALATREAIEPLVREAGFEDVAVADVPVLFRFPTWEEYRRVVTSLGAALRQTLAELAPATRAEVDAAARARLEDFRSGDGYELPGLALVTRAS
jgi:SAM-dependent methyltransferase